MPKPKLKTKTPRARIQLRGTRSYRMCQDCREYIRIGEGYEIIAGKIYHNKNASNCKGKKAKR